MTESNVPISKKTGKPYKEHTVKQSMAVKRNFGLMNLAAMQSQIYMVYNILTQERSKVQASIKLNAIHKHLEDIKQVVKEDYEKWKAAEAKAAKETPERKGLDTKETS